MDPLTLIARVLLAAGLAGVLVWLVRRLTRHLPEHPWSEADYQRMTRETHEPGEAAHNGQANGHEDDRGA